MAGVRRYFREALESADDAPTAKDGLWLAMINRLAFLCPEDLPEQIAGRFALWREAATFEDADRDGIGTARANADRMTEEEARELLEVLRSMAIEIGAVEK